MHVTHLNMYCFWKTEKKENQIKTPELNKVKIKHSPTYLILSSIFFLICSMHILIVHLCVYSWHSHYIFMCMYVVLPGEGNGNLLQYPCLENPMDRILVDHSPWGCQESDTTEWLHFHFHVVLMVKKLPANTGDIREVGSVPGLGKSSGGGHGNPLQYSCLENPMNRGAWWAQVHRVTESWTRLMQVT